MDLLNLENPIYTAARKVRGYTYKPTIFGINDIKKAAKIIKSDLPDLTADQADALRTTHDSMAQMMRGTWDYIVNKAAVETWGREYKITDYKISSIASDEFPAVYKELLRTAAHSQSKHNVLSQIYFEVWRSLKK